MVAGHFLLLVQEKVTKENTPSDPRRSPSERFATGGRVSPTGHPWPVVEIGAIPRAARVRCTRLFRPPFAAAQREPESKSGSTAYMRHRIYTTVRFCGRDCRALLFPGPSRPRRAGGGNSPKGHAQDARASDLGTRMCRERSPEPARVVCRHGCRQTAAARVPFSLATFFWASKRK